MMRALVESVLKKLSGAKLSEDRKGEQLMLDCKIRKNRAANLINKQRFDELILGKGAE